MAEVKQINSAEDLGQLVRGDIVVTGVLDVITCQAKPVYALVEAVDQDQCSLLYSSNPGMVEGVSFGFGDATFSQGVILPRGDIERYSLGSAEYESGHQLLQEAGLIQDYNPMDSIIKALESVKL